MRLTFVAANTLRLSCRLLTQAARQPPRVAELEPFRRLKRLKYMGADAFLAYYGLRWDVTDQEEIEALEDRPDPRLVAAREQCLKHWWGLTEDEDEGRYYLLIGYQLGNFGWEGSTQHTIADTQFAEIMEDTRRKLLVAGFDQPPAIHFQFEPDR